MDYYAGIDASLEQSSVCVVDGGGKIIREAVLCGPLLAARARARNLVYSMAYGDQPALICELVDWVRSTGFELTSAGKGMNFEPRYRYSTPDTVWGFFGWTEEEVAKGDFNPKMYNSFTDGTKAAIEMAAVANGTGLDCPDDGLAFPPAGLHDLAGVFRPAADGGRLARSGLVDIAASQEPDGREVSTTSATASSSPSRRQRIYARLLQAIWPAGRQVRAGMGRCGVRSTSSGSRPA